MIQIMTATTMITPITPTTAPALKMPATAEQLLKSVNSSNTPRGKMIFFMFSCFSLACIIIIGQVIRSKSLRPAIIQLHNNVIANSVNHFAFALRADDPLAL
jgi:hypothetical protein